MSKKILIVDDSALMRRVLCDIIATDKRFELAYSAVNGLEAYDLVVTNPSKYNLLILDINMPKMNGIQLLEKMSEKGIKIPVIIVSSIAHQGAVETIRCLELGAFDFITKPDSFLETKSEEFRLKVINLMCAALSLPPAEGSTPVVKPVVSKTVEEKISDSKPEEKKSIISSSVTTKKPVLPVKAESGDGTLDGPMSYVKVTGFEKKPHVSVPQSANKLVAVACSTGGPKALQSVIPMLPANLNAPVILVQHMPEGFTGTLAQRLNEMSKISVKEAEDGDVLKRGWVYIAKGGTHLRVIKKDRNYQIVLGDDPARNGLRPCADIMYESLTGLDFDEITCVVLTGMGSDGTRGIGQLCSKHNCYVIAQDEASSTVYGMPRMVKEAGVTDEVVTLSSVADAVAKVVGVC